MITKSKTKGLIAGIIAIIILLIIIGLSNSNKTISDTNPNSRIEGSNVCFEDTCFSVEIVDTPEERSQGLMFRTSLEQDAGMLFIFENSGIYPFWMKNTLIPLDMIWIDENLKVVYIQENATPCEEDPCQRYNPGVSALYVLEIVGGRSSEIGLNIGDMAEFNL